MTVAFRYRDGQCPRLILDHPDTGCHSQLHRGGANATVTALDEVAEMVSVTGSLNLTGWYLISSNGNQRLDFPRASRWRRRW